MAGRKKAAVVTDEMRVAADRQIKERQHDVRYDLRDFTVDYLVKSFQDDFFYIPAYQREFIWPESNKGKFIESVILGLPIPMLFVADMADGRLEIVDGAQRIQTLEQFVSGSLKLTNLSLLPTMEGFEFGDMTTPQQRKLLTRALRLVVLEDGSTEQIRQELFHRINTQSVKAKGSEVRRGSFQGPFLEFIQQCAQNPLFRKLCPVSEAMIKRREDEELVTRYFCYSDKYKEFRHDVDAFVDSYVSENRENFDRDRMSSEFLSMLEFVAKYFPYGFAKAANSKTTPRVRFEAISVGVTLAQRARPDLVPESLPSAWLESADFKQQTTTHASNSGPRLRGRVEFVRDKLLKG
ncbi:DUF262 domain-containing protein [Xanthomonas translucens pv. undulosa]|uniref:DUF262 domain-containing protein n=1 Tax=Xanthomonas campestris pv. translucens TaxID=343 RepID=UPI0019D679F3|nr:DUF262 domain-containing protein [Xanthomonas translucens]QSQ42428.1 DUF262 domain-containing protein [Xanthomonas translucens pv. translucens]QSQ49724.1 DUF262 domain-containing protein [Xanthomonas translucens pv. undulosa]